MIPLKSLIVEDSKDDAALLLRHLSSTGYDVQSTIVQTSAEMKAALADGGEWDIVLSDYTMPHFTGLDALSILKESGLDIPFIIVSGAIGEDVAVEAMLVGVHDYLMKGNLTRLAPAIEREIQNAASRRARQQAEETLRASEERFRSIVETTTEWIWAFDSQGNCAYSNPALETILGYTPEEFFGKSFLPFMHPEDREKIEQSLPTLIAEKRGWTNLVCRWYHKDGSVRDLESNAVPLFNSGGEVIGYRGADRDITERKQIEEALDQAARRERAMIENALDVICTINAEGEFVSVSPACLNVWGYLTDELIGRRYIDFVVPEDADISNAAALSVMSGHEIINFENRYRHKNGTLVAVRWSAYWSEPEQLMFCVAHDITERKLMEEERDRLIVELDTEKARLQHIFDNSPSFIVTLRGPDFIFERANTAYYQLVGQRDLIGISARDALPEFVEQGFLELVSRVYSTGEPFVGNEVSVELQPLNGKVREQHYVNIVSTPLREADNSISGVISYGVDVTEQVLSRIKIEESEERYRFLFKNNPLPMWVFDIDTLAFLSVNDVAVQHYGYSQEEFLTMTLKDIRPPKDVPALLENTKSGFLGTNKAGVFRHRKKDGTIIYVEIISIQLNFNGKNAELVLANDITERRQTEEALRNAEDKYRNLVESSPAIVYLTEPSPPFSTIYVSPNIIKFGYSAEEYFNRSDMWFSLIHEEDRERVLRITEAAMNQGLDKDLEYRIISRDGAIHWLHDKGRFVADDQGKRLSWQGVMVDITETKELEEKLRLSQKLESVGRLAGGIAHDFNNMLTAINGYSELTLRKLEEGNPLRRNIEEIKKAGERSAALTHQLLAFSRQQILQPVVLNLNEIINDTIQMLQRLIGEDVELVTALKPKTGRVNVDPGQLSQIIINLAVNARDAMPQGGKLTIETANILLKPEDAREKIGILPGAYVMLAVCDTGVGMDGKIRQHIFEPFFTTKEVGKGTGLGLATVYGIVKQSGGNIEVDSKVGVGTTFKIYLPRVAEQSEAVEIIDTSAEVPAGIETILLVEDEELVRNLSREILETCGYTVIEARNGLEAMEISENGNCKFDLLMTDVVMPEMGGRELAEILTEKLPNIQILFTSGYTDDAIVRHGVIEADTNFIQKPFTFDALARKVRELLDAEGFKAKT